MHKSLSTQNAQPIIDVETTFTVDAAPEDALFGTAQVARITPTLDGAAAFLADLDQHRQTSGGHASAEVIHALYRRHLGA